MKTEIIINGVKYNLDIQKAKKLGILKEKNQRCKSWEEFKNKYQNKQGLFYDIDNMWIEVVNNPITTTEQLTKNEAIAISAFSKLLKLRRDWIGDWGPDWSKSECKLKYCIVVKDNNIIISTFYLIQHPFSFPTEEMAVEFLNCFKDLFVQCKCLI